MRCTDIALPAISISARGVTGPVGDVTIGLALDMPQYSNLTHPTLREQVKLLNYLIYSLVDNTRRRHHQLSYFLDIPP